jgi:electron transport complex protein RnfD
MLLTLAALMPAAAVAVMQNGVHSFFIIALTAAAAVTTELTFVLIEKKRPVVIDGSAGLTGLLLALSFPPQTPLWMGPLGSLFAIAIVKHAFGGLGRNFLNPALAGRAFCALAFPAAVAAGAAPAVPFSGSALLDVAGGYPGGWIGGSSAGALLLGAAVVWSLRIIDVTLPLAFAGSAFVAFWLDAGTGHGLLSGHALTYALLQIGSGGLLLAALFMATDPVTSPQVPSARLLFGIGCGVGTFFFRKFGGANNGVVYAVLLMNLAVPYLDRYCGRVRKRKNHPYLTFPLFKGKVPKAEGVKASASSEELDLVGLNDA